MTDEHRHVTSAERLLPFERAWEPVHREMIRWLAPPRGARVLDAGCGAGGVTALLAEAIGPEGSVEALDVNADQQPYVERAVAAVSRAAPVRFRTGDVCALPYTDGLFDLVWCSRVVHGLPDQLAGVRELRRVTRPGGRVVLREGGLPARMLPADIGMGAPGLEDRLQVAQQRWFAQFRRALRPRVPYPYGWTQLLRDAGFEQVSIKSFLFELTPPFTAAQRDYLESLLRGAVEHPERAAFLRPDDRRTIERLLDREGPNYLFRRPDLHPLAVGALYVGTR